MKNSGFTLAEVLITLGIIGVVAAMTLPTLMQKRTNAEVEAKLKKIYSVMNQAILLSENDNGPKEYWDFLTIDGNYNEEFLDKYILLYLNKTSISKFESYGGIQRGIFFADGTLLISKNPMEYFFFPNAKNFDEETFFKYDDSGGLTREGCGITFFAFRFDPINTVAANQYSLKKGVNPTHGI